MKLSFRQGIVRHQQDALGTPTFLNVAGGNVSLIVSPDPTIITFVHGTKDYLYTERQSVPNAWGPFAPGADQWLYWQLNPVTGTREFGSTNLEPIETGSMPTGPNIGQMWFDTTTKMWREWNGASWVEKIRVFACRLENGTTPRSMSINAPVFTGTQVGLTTSTRAGGLAFDGSGKPIRTGDNKFFTTEDVFVTGVPSGASVRVSNILIPGIAQEPLAAYSVVEYDDFNKLVHASPYTQGIKLYGFIEEDAPTGEVINFITEGMIVNDDWDFVADGADVNDPVYNDSTGQLSLTPAIPDQLPVGVITGRSEILFSPRLFPQLDTTITVPLTFTELSDTPLDYLNAANKFVRVNSLGDGLVWSEVTHPDPMWGNITGSLSSQTDLLIELNTKAPLVHTHNELDITDLDKYTQAEVDSLVAGKSDIGHAHTETDITDLDKYTTGEVDIFLANKADILHGHNIADVANLQTELNGKAPTVHTHAIGDVTNLQTSLDAKVEDGANVGVGNGVFRNKTGTDLNFKTLVAGTNITLTPAADTITIDASGGGATVLNDLTDVNASSPNSGDIIAWDGSGWTTIAPSGGGAPLAELSHPYDFTFFTLDAIPSNAKVFKRTASHNITLLDYGHTGLIGDPQGQFVGQASDDLPGMDDIYEPFGYDDPSTTFTIHKNGTQIGRVGFTDDSAGGSGARNALFYADVGDGGWMSGYYLTGFASISRGDTLEIKSPTSPNAGMSEPAITLRGFVEPANPVGTLTVSFSKDASIGEFYDDPYEMPTITGDYTHVEMACLGFVSAGTFPPAAFGDFRPAGWLNSSNGITVEFDTIGQFDFQYSGEYHTITDPTDTIQGCFGASSGGYYLMRVTAFGPAGMATDLAWFYTVGS